MIDRTLALRYMGWRGEPDERISALMDDCETELLKAVKPRFVWRVFDISRTGSGIELSGCGFTLTGKDIARHLNGCTKAAITAATLSADADKLLKRLQLEDSAKALVADAMASVLAEEVSETAREEILREMNGYSATWCYAAGYGDLPLEITPMLIAAADASRKIGISCTGSNMMTPQKSIAGVIGLSENKLDECRKSCDSCNMRGGCKIRAAGEKCYR